jgi:PLP dependent protein
MSHDFTVAIAEGATMVRIGTAIFGERPAAGDTETLR